MAMIEVSHLVKRFGTTVAVNDVTFEVDRGEILGFLGPNGAGKTTTLKIITTFISSDGGSVTVGGYNVFAEPLEARKMIGYLPENTPLYGDMGIVEYLTYVCNLRGLKGATRSRRIREIVEACALGPEITKAIGQLSRGYRQRVGLAQAMIHDPEILILDEPTSGLDPNQIAEIRSLIRQIGKEKTIVLSTHILPEVTNTCDRAIIINEGRLVAGGTPAELQKRGSGGMLYATIRGPKADVQQALSAIPGIKKANLLSETDGQSARYAIETGAGADPSEPVFRMVVEKGWSLSELHLEAVSLEEVFRQLTVGKAA